MKMYPKLDAVAREVREYYKRYGVWPARIYLSEEWYRAIVDETGPCYPHHPVYTPQAEQSLLGIPLRVVNWIEDMSFTYPLEKVPL